jgi:threonyl-tRNA synthetase
MTNFDMDTIRHSAAHLMAQAIERLYKDYHPQFGIGPVVENGFYYDIEMDYKLTDEDLKKIEKEMKKIVKENLPIERKVLSRQEALAFLKSRNRI